MTTAIVSSSNAKVKFRLAGGAQPLILLPVHVNGSGPFDFILDTGAGTSLLSLELAKQLAVNVVGSKEGHSAGGTVSVSLAKLSSLAVGKIKLDDVDVGIVDLAHIGNTIGAKIDGDLGYNFLKYFRITIDYQAGEIHLDDPKRVESFARPAITEVTMRLASPAKPLILVDVYANGAGPFQFAVDTGTSTSAIAPELAKSLHLEGSPIGPATTGSAQIAATAGVLRTFQLGGAKIDNFTIMIADFFASLSQVVGAKLDGIVGYNFLRNYKVAIDYPNEMLSLIQP